MLLCSLGSQNKIKINIGFESLLWAILSFGFTKVPHLRFLRMSTNSLAFRSNTIQYFIDTPLVGLFSDNTTNDTYKNKLCNKYYPYIQYKMHT